MSCRVHTFTKPGCPYCALNDTTRTVKANHNESMAAQQRHAAQADARAAEQNRLLHQQNQIQAHMAAHQAEQTRIAAEQAERDDAFRFSQYAQSPHGQAFLAWEAQCRQIIDGIDRVGAAWVEAWAHAAHAVAGPIPAFPERVKPATPTDNKRVLITAGVITIGSWLLYRHLNSNWLAPHGAGTTLGTLFLPFVMVAGVALGVFGLMMPGRAERREAARAVDAWLVDYNTRLAAGLGAPFVEVTRAGAACRYGNAGGSVMISGAVPGGSGLTLHVATPWSSENVAGYRGLLVGFCERARHTFPSPEQFPTLRVPYPVAADVRFPEPVRAVHGNLWIQPAAEPGQQQ